MKKLIISLIIAFIIYSLAVNLIPVITDWDISLIHFIQGLLSCFPVRVATIFDSGGYAIGLIAVLVFGCTYFLRKYLLIDLVLFCSAPAVAYIVNTVVKLIIARPRPPLSLQLIIHPSSYGFVSNHTFITCSLYALAAYYLIKYCKSGLIKCAGVAFAIFWMFFTGLSRVWLGVHYPTDVLGGCFLAAILVLIYIRLINLIGGK